METKSKTKKAITGMLALVLSASLAACSSSTPSSPNATAGPSGSTSAMEEPVELTIFAHNLSVDKTGVQTDPVAKEIEKKLGIRLNVIDSNNNAGDEKNKLATYMAGNDLPDIFWVPDAATLRTAVDSGQALKLNDLWTEENAPNMTGGNPDAQKRQDFYAKSNFDGDRYGIQMWGGTGGASFPTVGFYVPWDTYKEAGYPEVNSLDDLVKVIAEMSKIKSTTEDGQKVYGVGGWFAESIGWGEWMVSLLQNAFGYQTDGNFVYTFDMNTNDLLDKPAITDPDSPWWDSVKFMYQMNQAGLIDPDSTTQKYDQWQEKAYSGRYLLVAPGWESGEIKAKTGLSYVALKPFENTNMVMDWSGELTGYTYAISKNSKHPDKALQLLDYLWSPEGSRLIHSGIEGESWEMVDGKPEFTEKYLNDKKTMNAVELVEKYGVAKYPMFVGYASNVVSPKDQGYFDLTMTPKYEATLLTDSEKDAFKYYGVESRGDIYRTNAKEYVFKFPEYSDLMPIAPDAIKKDASDLGNYVYRNYLNAVYAKNDADFEAKKQTIIKGAADYKIDALYTWYKAEFDKVKAQVDAAIE